MNIMFLDVTHQHSDKKLIPQSRSPKKNSRGSRPAPQKCHYAHRQPTPDPSFNRRAGAPNPPKRETSDSSARSPTYKGKLNMSTGLSMDEFDLTLEVVVPSRHYLEQ